MKYHIPYRWKRKLSKIKRALQRFTHNFRLRYHFFKDDLYEFSHTSYPWLRAISVFLGVFVFISILLPLVFSTSTTVQDLSERIDHFLLVGYGAYFYLRLSLTVHPKIYFRSRWPEAILSTLSLVFGLDLLLSDGTILISLIEQFGFSGTHEIVLTVVQIYLLFIVGVKIVQVLPEILSKNQNPAQLVLISFISAILAGMLLLMLPSATVDGDGLGFIDALFMSTSAVCVTGLIVVDTATHLTFFGQAVILLLIQIGGIGVITFATFLALYLAGGLGLIERNVLQHVISGEEVRTISKTLKHIVLITFSVEFIGFVSYYIGWADTFADTGQRIWFSLFHAVSAFCNAGFSVYTNSLSDPLNATSIPINATTMILIIVGGIGFTTIWEFITRISNKPLKKKLSIHSIIVLKMTAFLIISGTAAVLLLEWNGLLADYSFSDKLLFSAFQSVTSRTAGFNTLDTGALSAGTTMVIITLMIIGASPSSTAGGLKTTTVYALYKAVIANITGKGIIEISNRTLPNSVVFRAITAVFLAFSVMLTGLIILSATEDFTFLDLLFEQVSAFMTVGLSRGITSGLSPVGKSVLIFSMFAGRVGMLTVAIAFAKRGLPQNYKYPEESIMVA